MTKVFRARLRGAPSMLFCLSVSAGCASQSPVGDLAVSSEGDPTQASTPSSLASVPASTTWVRAKLTTNGSATPALHTCGLREDGALLCWGDDSFGELGVPPHMDRYTPTLVQLADVVDVAAGWEATCAVVRSGAAWCWGDARFGELGNGTGGPTAGESDVPVQVIDLPAVNAIAAGLGLGCALARGGAVWCWGGNFLGSTAAAYLGNGSPVQSTVPVPVSGLEDVVELAGTFQHFCAVRASGGVRCWGHNASGQLGDGTTTDRLTPVDVVDLNDAVAVATGWNHSCARRKNGRLRCWGDNQYGQLGDGTTNGSTVPVDVSELPEVLSVAAGNDDTCAVLADGTARCWGWEGRLYNTPDGGQQLGAGGGIVYSVAKLTPAVTITLFGFTVTAPLGDLATITTGNFFGTTCALTRLGEAFCWGDDSEGEVGNGAVSFFAPVPQPVPIGFF